MLRLISINRVVRVSAASEERVSTDDTFYLGSVHLFYCLQFYERSASVQNYSYMHSFPPARSSPPKSSWLGVKNLMQSNQCDIDG